MLRGLRRALFWEMKKKSCWGSAVRGAAQEILGLMLFEKQLQNISIVRHDAGIVMGGLC